MTFRDNVQHLHGQIEDVWVLCIRVSPFRHQVKPALLTLSSTSQAQPKESPTQLQPRLIPRADMAFMSPKRPESRADKLEVGIYWAHWLGVRSIADNDCFHHQGLSISRGEESLFKLMKTSITVKPVGRLSILCGLGGLLGVDLCSLFIATHSFTEIWGRQVARKGAKNGNMGDQTWMQSAKQLWECQRGRDNNRLARIERHERDRYTSWRLPSTCICHNVGLYSKLRHELRLKHRH